MVSKFNAASIGPNTRTGDVHAVAGRVSPGRFVSDTETSQCRALHVQQVLLRSI